LAKTREEGCGLFDEPDDLFVNQRPHVSFGKIYVRDILDGHAGFLHEYLWKNKILKIKIFSVVPYKNDLT
jgi:hypothetical protein